MTPAEVTSLKASVIALRDGLTTRSNAQVSDANSPPVIPQPGQGRVKELLNKLVSDLDGVINLGQTGG